jgi:hypothetical protein
MSDKPSVDDLRNRLRELGYLDAGVDRFVLGPVRGSRGLVSVAWRSSARIGLLAGLLLGPSTVAALAVRVPGLVTGIRDAVVLAIYLGVFFGAAVAAASFLAALGLGTLASRTRDAPRSAATARVLAGGAGVLVAAGCLIYLVFWWRTVGPAGVTAYRSPWTWLVLGVAAVVSLLLGHLVRLTTLAVTARGEAASWALLGRSRHSRTLSVGLAVLAFAGAAGLLAVSAPREPADARAQAARKLAVTSTGQCLTVVAVDGLDVEYLDRLAGEGRTPTLARLLSGATATLPASDAPDPARTWTSVATGQPATIHGVGGIETRRVSGTEGTVEAGSGIAAAITAATDALRLTRPALSTSVQRRAKTFWEAAADAGLTTVVVNWWATWPVPERGGIVLSDRATLRLDRGGALDAEIAPPSLYPTLLQAWPRWRDEVRRDIVSALPAIDGASDHVLRRAAEQDLLPARLVERLAVPGVRLRAVYLPGLDIAQHELLGSRGGLPPSALASRVDALERYYVFLDGVVSRLVAGARDDDLVALVADPGRAASRGRALLALSGRIARPGAHGQADRQDVMPTLLYALGLPMSRELPGRPRTELFEERFTTGVPVRFVDTYGPRTVAPRPANATPLDQEMFDRLRSLGYVR